MPRTLKERVGAGEGESDWLADANVVFVSERLTYNGVVASGQSAENGVCVFAWEEARAGFRFAACESGWETLIGDGIGAETIDTGDAGDLGDAVGDGGGHGGMTVGGGTAGGTEIEIGFELVVHPDGDGLTEAADHDADAGGHGDGGGECGGENGRAAEGRAQGAESEHGFCAKEDLDGAGGEAGKESDDCGDGGGRSGDEKQNGGIGSEGLAVEGGELGEDGTGEQH